MKEVPVFMLVVLHMLSLQFSGDKIDHANFARSIFALQKIPDDKREAKERLHGAG